MDLNLEIEKLRETVFMKLAVLFDVAVSREIYDAIKRAQALPSETAADKATAIAHNKAAIDFMPLKTLIDKMQQHGRPKGLVFIDQEGNSHDLLNRKGLNEIELIDLFLDTRKREV